MRKKFLTIAVSTLLIGIAPALAQEEPAATPAPSAEQAPTTPDSPKKAEPAAHPKRVRHYGHIWPWNWVWYHWRYALYHHHHRM